jgi:hypothetical protein
VNGLWGLNFDFLRCLVNHFQETLHHPRVEMGSGLSGDVFDHIVPSELG